MISRYAYVVTVQILVLLRDRTIFVKKNIPKYWAGLLLFTVVLNCAALDKLAINLYRYNDLFIGASSVILNFEDGYILIDDVGRKLYRCSNEEFFCFYSDSISFAVPKKDFEATKEWSHNSRKYVNEGKIMSSIWGVDREQYLITMVLDEVKYLFLYSEKFGLSSIRIESSELGLGRDFVINHKYGFPIE